MERKALRFRPKESYGSAVFAELLPYDLGESPRSLGLTL
jgi:hypothetical protein